MILKLYSVYDMKAKIYHPLDGYHNDGHAMRAYRTIFNRPDTMFQKYPDDFQVWEVAKFNDETAQVEVLQNPTLLCTARDLLVEDTTPTFPAAEKQDAK